MFEQIKPTSGNQPIEDIFSTTEKPPVSPSQGGQVNQNIPIPQPAGPLPPTINQSVGPVQPLTNLKEIQMEPEKKKSGFLPVLIIVILVIVLGGLGYLAYGKFFGNQPNANLPANKNLTDNQNINTNQPVTNQDLNVNEQAVENINEEVIMDSDKDGLLDSEEKSLGTDINEVDTDGDNLYDFEEVKTFQTNPLNPDTDSDGYLDGEEVRGGYNPKGPGKMLNLP